MVRLYLSRHSVATFARLSSYNAYIYVTGVLQVALRQKDRLTLLTELLRQIHKQSAPETQDYIATLIQRLQPQPIPPQSTPTPPQSTPTPKRESLPLSIVLPFVLVVGLVALLAVAPNLLNSGVIIDPTPFLTATPSLTTTLPENRLPAPTATLIETPLHTATSAATPTPRPPTATPTVTPTQMLAIQNLGVVVYNAAHIDAERIGVIQSRNIVILGRSVSSSYLLIQDSSLVGWIEVAKAGNLPISIDALPVLDYVAPTNTPRPPRPTYTPIVAETILLEENFEDGTAQQFMPNGGTWNIITDDANNKVMRSSTMSEVDGHYNLNFGSTQWKNYQVTYRVKFTDYVLTTGHTAIYCRVGVNNQDGYGLIISVNSNNIEIVKIINQGWNRLDSVRVNLTPNQWHTIHWIINEATMTVYVDGMLVLSVNDTSYTAGRCSLQVGPKTSAQFDDVKIIALAGN